jgi:hypothetical protein
MITFIGRGNIRGATRITGVHIGCGQSLEPSLLPEMFNYLAVDNSCLPSYKQRSNN